MKKLLLVIWSGFIVVVFCTCSSHQKNEYRDKQNHMVVDENYSNSRIKTRIVYLNDDKTDYIYTSYYEDGTLMDSARYVDDKIEGKRIYFEEKSELKHEENYTDGKLNGLHKAVYSDGTTSYQGFRKNDNKVGEWIFHFPSGAPITYEFYDSTGKLLYFRKYDESGRAEKSNGNPFIYIADKGKMVSDDSASVEVVVIHPPLSKTILSVKNTLADDTTKVAGSNVITDTRMNFRLQISQPGSYPLQFMLDIQNPDNGESKRSEVVKTVTFTDS